MSDGVQILLFSLALLAPVVLVIGLVMFLSRKSGTKGRNRGPVSSSESFNDIINSID